VFLSLKELELRKVKFDLTFQPGEIEFFDKKIWQATPLKLQGEAELLDNTIGEIRLRGRLDVRMEAECDRCLETASFPVQTDFDLFYRPAARATNGHGETELEDDESEVGFYEGGGVELRDVVREHVLLSLPMQKVCSETCKGICPVCGRNRNQENCRCEVKAADDRWAALKSLAPSIKKQL
jgi:uncharacterized protein